MGATWVAVTVSVAGRVPAGVGTPQAGRLGHDPAGAAREGVGSYLLDLGAAGLQETAEGIHGYFPAGSWTPAEAALLRRYLRGLRRLGVMNGAGTVAAVPVPPQEWATAWHAAFRPVRVSRRVRVRAAWHPAPADSTIIDIGIHPGQAFGTGSHESTRLLLRLVERFGTAGWGYLDVGTGSGVAAILAVRLGMRPVQGIDGDPLAAREARRNLRLNGLGGQACFRTCAAERPRWGRGRRRFEVVGVNLEWHLLEPVLPHVTRAVVPAGVLLLSGLLDRQRGPAVARLRREGWQIRRTLRIREWVGMACVRTGGGNPQFDRHLVCPGRPHPASLPGGEGMLQTPAPG